MVERRPRGIEATGLGGGAPRAYQSKRKTGRHGEGPKERDNNLLDVYDSVERSFTVL